MRPRGHHPTLQSLPSPWTIEGVTVDPAGERRRVRVTVDANAGRILSVGEPAAAPDIVLDDALLLLPGFIDVHVHCRDDAAGREHYKEDFASASMAALHGGVVLVGDMPNNADPTVDDASYRAKCSRARERSLIDVVPYVGITPGGRPIATPAPYKCYFGPSIGPLNLHDDADVESVLAPFRDQLIVFHAESPAVLAAHRDAATHEERRPAAAEARAIADIADLAARLGLRVHIAHLSSAAGLAEVRRARGRGVSMTTEVTPHHLFFHAENRGHHAHGEWLQMNPPLRSAADCRALMAALLSGEIEMLATDHAPHSREENRRGISGVPHLDTFGAFVCHLAHAGFPWPVLVERVAAAPARLFAPFIEGRLGGLEAGGVASFTVVDPDAPWSVSSTDLATRSGWSPFEGVELPGRVAMTAVRGRLWTME